MKIGIIGCGYVGINLVKILHKKGTIISATTEDPKLLKVLNSLTQKSAFLKDANKAELIPIIDQNDVIILTIASDPKKSFFEKLIFTATQFKEAAKFVGEAKSLIYLSRTNVYGDRKGLWVDENTEPKPQDEIERQLLETEEILLSLKESGWNVCIFRVAEVYGPDFELSKKISNSSDYFYRTPGNTYTNMVHLDDIVKAVKHALEHNLDGIYNLADDDHPTLKELLKKVGEKLKLPEVKWDPKSSKGKAKNFKVSNHKIKSTGFIFTYPHRLIC